MMIFSRLFWLILSCAGLLSVAVAHADTPFNACEKKITLPLEVWSSGWSRDFTQQRIDSEQQAGLSAADLPSLDVAWTFAFKGAVHPRSFPAVTAQAIFIGSEEGGVYALDTQSGCGYWRFQAEDEVRSAITIGTIGDKTLLFFGDIKANAYAIDAATGALVWKIKLDDNKLSVITGSPVFYKNNVYIPVSSWEVGLAAIPLYGCCKFRGVLTSINALTGTLNWKNYSIAEEPKPSYRNMLGVQQYAPSGAGMWSAPTIDEKRQRIYIGTGQNYSGPANNLSDALLAFDLNNGKLLWSKQVLPQDAWNAACGRYVIGMNCPKEDGMDYDIGATTMLVTRNSDGKEIILAGSKSGMAYAMDPDNNGEILWQKPVGRGGLIGGIHWGMAADRDYLYVPVSDTEVTFVKIIPGKPRPGLSKLRLSDGETEWFSSTLGHCKEDGCRNGLSAAITGIPGAIIAPALDGFLRAYDMNDGHEFWSFDTTQPQVGVNGVQGHGGSMDGGGVVASHGMLFFNSGYGGLISVGGTKGNVFFVLKKTVLKKSGEASAQP